MNKTLLRFLLFVGLAAVLAASSGTRQPNVVFIALDDLNDWPGFMRRYPDAMTPHMDRLAGKGMTFDRAHIQYPICGPSRASIFSGFQPGTLRGFDRMKDSGVDAATEQLGSRLLHQWFRDHGYKTMAVGKLMHNHVPRSSVDLSGGRGDWNKMPDGKRVNWHSSGTSTDWGPYPGDDAQMSDHRAATWAVERLGENHEKPFMLMVGFIRPHVPWHVPQEWFDRYPADKPLTTPPYKPDDWDDLPKASRQVNLHPDMPRTEWAIQQNKWQEIIRAYLASITFADHQVGRVLDALERSPYAGNTLIVLWSDHGYHMGEKNTFQKHSLWERSSHVPLIFAGPGIKPGSRCDRVVSLLDLYPTLSEYCGVPSNPKNEGRSLLPLLKEPTREWNFPALTEWRDQNYAIQTERFRYIRYKDGTEELYDHRVDLTEWRNLAGDDDYKSVKADLAGHVPPIVASKPSRRDGQ